MRASVAWDPDGAGPLPSLAVFGGDFTAVGNQLVNHIAAWNPATSSWSPFAAGLNGPVRALAVLANGDLVAAGLLTDGAGPGQRTVVRWTGSNWQPLGAGFTHPAGADIRALQVLTNGDLVVGGRLANVGATAVANAARWTGSSWQAMGVSAGLGASSGVTALTVTSTGFPVAGGGNSVRQWNGTDWILLGPANLPLVHALSALPNGAVFAGVEGWSLPGYPGQVGVLHWDGVAWSDSTGAPSTDVRCFVVLQNGDVVCGGGAVPIGGGNFARFDGIGWSYLPGYVWGTIHTIAPQANGDLVVGGSFASVDTAVAANLARLGAGTWSSLGGSNLGSNLTAMRTLQNGDLVAAGYFASGRTVARWNGTSWVEYAGSTANNLPLCIAELSNGDLVVGGLSFRGVALERWDGASWTAMFAPMEEVLGVLQRPNGDLVLAGNGGVQIWDGIGWTALGGGLAGGLGMDLVQLPNGDLIVGGSFTLAGSTVAHNIARWDGAAWFPLGASINGPVSRLAVTSAGEVVAGGSFTMAGGVPANGIARWDGAAWHALGSGFTGGSGVSGIEVLPDGDVVVAGDFTQAGGVAALHIARWNGSAWTAFTSGTTSTIHALAWLPRGVLAVGGDFMQFGGAIATAFAAIGTTCPASTSPLGAGCPSSGGANVLTPRSLPWVEATFRAEAAGLPAASLALAVTSFVSLAPPLALASVFPSQPGCDLHVAPDILGLLLPSAGTVESSLFLPNTPPLVGLTFHHQLVVCEFDAQGAFVDVTATNALSLTVGDF